MRDINAAALLDLFWIAPEGAAYTASELIERSGLTRATVLAICSDLRDLGWLIEDRAPSAVPGRGRQARRFTFNAQRQLVVGADVGVTSVTCVVANLHGEALARVRRRFEWNKWGDKTLPLARAIDEALQVACVAASEVGAACIGVAAPVDANGDPLPGNEFWQQFRLDRDALGTIAPWPILIENDADLAALAELAAEPDSHADPLIALLASDRFGAGITVRGALLRGAHGGAGEMAYLDYVNGVGHPFGLSQIARLLIEDARENGRATTVGSREPGGEETVLQEVIAAAENGEDVAGEVVTEVIERLAMTIASFAQFLDPAKVIIAGGVAEVVSPLLPRVRARLRELIPLAPEVVSSTLGRDVVVAGAVQRAIQSVRRAAFAG